MINKKLISTSLPVSVGLLLAVYCFMFAPTASAAAPRVYLERVGSFGVRVLLDSDEPVNAYDIQIAFDRSVVTIDSLDASRSIVTVVPAPISSYDGVIPIKGGSTKAFSGTRGELLSFTLKPLTTGVVEFVVSKAEAYLADGKGTKLALQSASLPMRVTSASLLAYTEAEQSGLLGPEDREPPQITTIEIQANPLNYGERLVVFQAMDKETGVARYEARERSWLAWSAWRTAFNPYPLDPGAWQIQIKAVDYNNNIALATVYQLGNALWKTVVGIVLLALILFGIRALVKRK